MGLIFSMSNFFTNITTPRERNWSVKKLFTWNNLALVTKVVEFELFSLKFRLDLLLWFFKLNYNFKLPLYLHSLSSCSKHCLCHCRASFSGRHWYGLLLLSRIWEQSTVSQSPEGISVVISLVVVSKEGVVVVLLSQYSHVFVHLSGNKWHWPLKVN